MKITSGLGDARDSWEAGLILAYLPNSYITQPDSVESLCLIYKCGNTQDQGWRIDYSVSPQEDSWKGSEALPGAMRNRDVVLY